MSEIGSVAKPHNLLLIIRYLVFAAGVVIAGLLFGYYFYTIPDQQLLLIRLTQAYGFGSLMWLYLALLPGPLTEAYPKLPGRGLIIRARRSIGVLAFLYGLLHSLIAFFGQLEGFAGLGFLSPGYLTALILGFIALVIMTLMALTSFDYWMRRLGRFWKILHRFIYLGGWLIIFHTVMVGTHFGSFQAPASQILIIALASLLILEARRVDDWWAKRNPATARFSLPFVILTSLIVTTGAYLLISPAAGSLGIHAQHLTQTGQGQPSNSTPLDTSRRYNVSLNLPNGLEPNQPVTLKFAVTEANTGNPVQLFTNLHQKPSHLIIVDQELNRFSHLHPSLTGQGFTTETSFPQAGQYRLYFDFQPLGGLEQYAAQVVTAGQPGLAARVRHQPDQSLTKTSSGYRVTLDQSQPFKASQLNWGQQSLRFRLVNQQTGQPVTDLQPYLGAFGHLVMINQETFEYIHIHPRNPNNLPNLPAEARGGPEVEFVPIALQSQAKPGIYRIFVEFNPAGQPIQTDFTIKVE